jgi:hypothetical protein
MIALIIGEYKMDKNEKTSNVLQNEKNEEVTLIKEWEAPKLFKLYSSKTMAGAGTTTDSTATFGS